MINVKAVHSFLIKAIKDALGTEEDGFALIEVARNAHKAELKLSTFINKCSKVETESELLEYIEELMK